MADNSLLSILHLSDFHFQKRKARDQTIVVDALVADLKTLCIGHRKPDLVIFTGDLVQAAGVDRHEDAYDVLIEPVSKTVGCSDERIFIIPGNHDLAWKALDQLSEDHQRWRQMLGTPEEMDRLNTSYLDGEFDTPVDKKFSEFFELERYIRGDDRTGSRILRNAFVTLDRISALNIELVALNTAALSTGGHRRFESDERRLGIAELAIEEAIKLLSSGSLKVFAAHHPFSMLSEASSRYLEATVQQHADIYLYGHMHDPQPRSVVGLRGKVLSDQAGAIFTARRNAYIGYSLITLDRSNGLSETHLRTYYNDRKAFDEATDVIEGGRWYPSQEAREHFRKIATPVDEAELREHLCGSALAGLRSEESAAGGEGDLHHKFVPPPLNKTFIQSTSGEYGRADIESPLPFDDIVNGDGNIILYASAEYGRTTLLRELRLRLLTDAQELGFPRVPVVADFTDIKSNADNMLRLAKARAVELPSGHDLESLLKLGHVCMMIDDVVFGDSKRIKILRDFVSRFPKARYILSSLKASATAFGAHVDPEMPVRFEFVEVKELRRGDMRQLLVKFEKCTDVEEWLDRLQREFREINLPFTAANGSILMEILQEKHNFTPINRAVLIEQFVDSTLQKATIEQSRRATFDYTNKTDLLAHIASWMALNDNYVPPKESVRAEMASYINSMGLNVPLDHLMLEFLTARIFVNRPEERISFRYRAVLEYFIALKMTSDIGFKSWIMQENRYLQYINEIQYYAGKLRNDATLVQDIRERFLDIFSQFENETGEIDLSLLEKLEIPGDEEEDLADSLAEQLAAPPLSKEEKDEELQADLPVDEDTRQEVFRPAASDLGDRVMLSLLLYSGVVKNMELIADADKRRHLADIWRGWSVILHTALRVAPKLARDRRVRLNGVLYEILAPQGMSTGALARQIMIAMPAVQIKMLSAALGTEKLERQLTEPGLDETGEPLVYTLLRTGLIADLRLSSTPGAVGAALAKFKDSNYLLRALIIHLGELRRLDRVREEHFKRLEEPLAGAFANLQGAGAGSWRSEKRRQIARLAKERLLISIKRDKDKQGNG